MSQNDIILTHLKEHGSITSIEAVNRYGITRLAARISDLKKRGIEILTRETEVKTRYGRTARIAVYTLNER